MLEDNEDIWSHCIGTWWSYVKLIKMWRCEDLKIHVLIKLGVCVESEFHIKNTKFKD